MIKVHKVLATGFGSGCSPFAPGTTGSAAALLAIILLRKVAGWQMTPLSVAAAGIFLTALAIWSADAHARHLGAKDPGEIVIDEWCGMLFTFLFVNWNAAPAWMIYTGAFLWFRCCDIIKPPPARQLERLPGGWGIVLDDVAAGVWASAILYTLLKVKTLWLG